MCTGRWPGAIWDPITGRDRGPNVIERMIIHTAWVDVDDIYGPGRGQGATYAHFYNPDDGAMRQHQELDRMGRASLDANGHAVDVEHQDPRRAVPMTDAQVGADARLFAHLVVEHGLPNRIATPQDTRGLAWHRLGVAGNFGAFDPDDPKTWSRAQTGQRWTTVRGKTCPTNPRIDQIKEIWARAQPLIQAGIKVSGTITVPSEEDDMLPDIIFTSRDKNGGEHLYGTLGVAAYTHIDNEADYKNIRRTRTGHEPTRWENAAGTDLVENPTGFGAYVGPDHLRPKGA